MLKTLRRLTHRRPNRPGLLHWIAVRVLGHLPTAVALGFTGSLALAGPQHPIEQTTFPLDLWSLASARGICFATVEAVYRHPTSPGRGTRRLGAARLRIHEWMFGPEPGEAPGSEKAKQAASRPKPPVTEGEEARLCFTFDPKKIDLQVGLRGVWILNENFQTRKPWYRYVVIQYRRALGLKPAYALQTAVLPSRVAHAPLSEGKELLETLSPAELDLLAQVRREVTLTYPMVTAHQVSHAGGGGYAVRIAANGRISNLARPAHPCGAMPRLPYRLGQRPRPMELLKARVLIPQERPSWREIFFALPEDIGRSLRMHTRVFDLCWIDTKGVRRVRMESGATGAEADQFRLLWSVLPGLDSETKKRLEFRYQER